jgi:hypothetical protein
MSTSKIESTSTTENSPLMVENFCRLVQLQLKDYQEVIKKGDAEFSERDNLTIASETMTWKKLKRRAHKTVKCAKELIAMFYQLANEQYPATHHQRMREMLSDVISNMNKHQFYLAEARTPPSVINKTEEIAKRQAEVNRYGEILNRLMTNFSETKISSRGLDYRLEEVRSINSIFLYVVHAKDVLDPLTHEMDLKAIMMATQALAVFDKQPDSQPVNPEQSAVISETYEKLLTRGEELERLIGCIGSVAGPDDKIDPNSDKKLSDLNRVIHDKYTAILQAAHQIKNTPASDSAKVLREYIDEIFLTESTLSKHFDAFKKARNNKPDSKQLEQELLYTLETKIGEYRELISSMDKVLKPASILRDSWPNSCCWEDIKRDGLDYCSRLEECLTQSRKVSAGKKPSLDGGPLDPRSMEGLEKLKGNIKMLEGSFSHLQTDFNIWKLRNELLVRIDEVKKVVRWLDEIAGPDDKVDPSSDRKWSGLKESIDYKCKIVIQGLKKIGSTVNPEEFLRKYIQETIDMRSTLYEQLEAFRKAKDNKKAVEEKYAEFQSYVGDLQAIILRIDGIAGPDDNIDPNSDKKWSETKEAIGVKYIPILQAAQRVKSTPAADSMMFLCQYIGEILEMKSVLNRHFDAFKQAKDKATKDKLLETHSKHQDHFDDIDKQISELNAQDKRRFGELVMWRPLINECMSFLKKNLLDIMEGQSEESIRRRFDAIDKNLKLLDTDLKSVSDEKLMAVKEQETRNKLSIGHHNLETRFKWVETDIDTILNDVDRENFNKLILWHPTKIFCIKLLADSRQLIDDGAHPLTIRHILEEIDKIVIELCKHYAEVLAQKEVQIAADKEIKATITMTNVTIRVFMDDVWKLSLRLDGESKSTYRVSIIGQDQVKVIRHRQKSLEFVNEIINSFRHAYCAKKIEFKIMARLDTEKESQEFAAFSTTGTNHYQMYLAAALLHLV